MKNPQEWKSNKWWSHLSEKDRMDHFMGSLKKRPRDTAFGKDYIPTNSVVSLESKATSAVEDYEVGDSVVVYGSAGSGKTTYGAHIAAALIRKGLSARAITADSYIDMLKNSFDEGGVLPAEYNDPYALKHIRSSYDVLLIDDLEGTRKTEFANHEIGSLIRSRYDSMLTTVVTTSLKANDIVARFGERLATPLAEFDWVRP